MPPHTVQRTVAAVVLTAALVACSGGSTAPKFPQLSGSYGATFAVNFVNAVDLQTASTTGTITLNAPDGGGNFTGSFVLANGGGSGTISGMVRTDGGISISQFGDPNQSAAAALQYLQNIFSWCDFTRAGGSPMSGNVSGGMLSLSGSIALPCAYQNLSTGAVTNYTTTISETISGTRG